MTGAGGGVIIFITEAYVTTIIVTFFDWIKLAYTNGRVFVEIVTRFAVNTPDTNK